MLQLRKASNGYLIQVHESPVGYDEGKTYVFTDWDNVISFIKEVKFEEENTDNVVAPSI